MHQPAPVKTEGLDQAVDREQNPLRGYRSGRAASQPALTLPGQRLHRRMLEQTAARMRHQGIGE